MAATTITAQQVNAAREALYAREAAGQQVSVDEWVEVGRLQQAYDTQEGVWLPNGYMAGVRS
jgi:cation transport regulator ChaC